MIFQLSFPLGVNLGIQFLGNSTDPRFGIVKIQEELTHNLLSPAGQDTIRDYLADGYNECFLTSLVVLEKTGMEGKLPDLGFNK